MRGGEAINYVPINRFQVCRPGDAKDISFHSHCSTKICSSVEQLCHWGERHNTGTSRGESAYKI